MTARVCGRNRSTYQLLQHLSKTLGVAMNVVIARQQPHRQLNSSGAGLGLVVLQNIAEHAVDVKELSCWRCYLSIEHWRIRNPWNGQMSCLDSGIEPSLRGGGCHLSWFLQKSLTICVRSSADMSRLSQHSGSREPKARKRIAQ